MLIHSECGGELQVDSSKPAQYENEESGSTNIWRGVKCNKCGLVLGALANVETCTTSMEGVRV